MFFCIPFLCFAVFRAEIFFLNPGLYGIGLTTNIHKAKFNSINEIEHKIASYKNALKTDCLYKLKYSIVLVLYKYSTLYSKQ